jgi:hypothetical protein
VQSRIEKANNFKKPSVIRSLFKMQSMGKLGGEPDSTEKN